MVAKSVFLCVSVSLRELSKRVSQGETGVMAGGVDVD